MGHTGAAVVATAKVVSTTWFLPRLHGKLAVDSHVMLRRFLVDSAHAPRNRKLTSVVSDLDNCEGRV